MPALPAAIRVPPEMVIAPLLSSAPLPEFVGPETSILPPLIVRDIFNIVEQLNEQGVTVVLVEQNAKQSLKLADYAYVLEVGSVSMEGPAEELLKDDRVIEAYLGKS